MAEATKSTAPRNKSAAQSPKESKKPEGAAFHRKKGFGFFGLNKQDCIRYFFGGNASAAILILALICVFLFLQGKNFLPESHQSLQIARGSGIDLHDLVDKEYQLIKQFNAGFSRIFTTEYYFPGKHYDNLAKSHEATLREAESPSRRDLSVLKDLESAIKKYEESGPPKPPVSSAGAGSDDFAIAPEELAELKNQLAEFTKGLEEIPSSDDKEGLETKRTELADALSSIRGAALGINPPEEEEESDVEVNTEPVTLEKLKESRKTLIDRIAARTREALDEMDRYDIYEARDISDEEFKTIKDEIASLAEEPNARSSAFPLYSEWTEKRDKFNAEKLDFVNPINARFMKLRDESAKPLDELWSEISKHAVSTKERALSAATVVNRLKGPYGIYRKSTDSRVKSEKLSMMLAECTTAEFFHPGARLYFIAALNTMLEDQSELYSKKAREEAQELSKELVNAVEGLVVAAGKPDDLDGLREAYEKFGRAATKAETAISKMKTAPELYEGTFHGEDGKKVYESLQGYLETISAAVPEYRQKISQGSFGDEELKALEQAAGEAELYQFYQKPLTRFIQRAGWSEDKAEELFRSAFELILTGESFGDDDPGKEFRNSILKRGEIDDELSADLLSAVGKYDGGKGDVEYLTAIVEVAPDCQLEFPFDELAKPLYEAAEKHGPIVEALKKDIEAALEQVPEGLQSPYAQNQLKKMRKEWDGLVDDIDYYSARIENWNHKDEQTFTGTVAEFLAGKKWTNNSAIQDRYGMLPLLAGSFIISLIAVAVAVPIGLSAAIYVNQIAGARQQKFLKPVVEFIESIPSVVLGFLGIAVLGDMLKDFSEGPWVDWMPGMPINARLNMLTAALLLAFMAIPTIFSISEDALNNVPQHYRQASLALGATNLQTAFRVMLPAALSGVIAAVLLGFGRVIGETMVVLLVAGGRIQLPEVEPAFEWIGLHPATSWALGLASLISIGLIVLLRVKKGLRGGLWGILATIFLFPLFTTIIFFVLSFATQPSHTMTGIIAQNLSEAPVGSTNYQALFMVGLVLFTISLIINYVAQKVVTALSIENQIKKKKKPALKSTTSAAGA